MPTTLVSFENQTVSSSNPGLRPQTANNFDFSAEYYFEPAGVVSVGVFLKEIKQFIYTAAKVTPLELKEYAAAKGYKDLEKNSAKYLEELSREKFANLANHMLRQLTSKQEVKSFLEQREKGR